MPPRRTPRRPPAPAPVPAVARALEHGAQAAGAEDRRAGFAFTAEDDLAFALGFPHYVAVTEGAADPRAEAARLLVEGYPFLAATCDRAALFRLVRALSVDQPVRLGPDATPVVQPPAHEALDRDEPLTDLEALDLARLAAVTLHHQQGTARLRFVEALAGTRVALDGALRGLEEHPRARWERVGASHTAHLLDLLCLFALRLPRPELQAFEARIAALAAHLALEPARAEACGLTLAMLRGTAPVQPPRLVVRAAADVVRRARQADREAWYSLPDPRLVFLGGDEVYEVELAHALRPAGPTPPAEAHLLALERFGRIRSPHSVALALDLAAHGRAKARAAAQAWLTAHAAFAAPHLRALADGDSARAAGARAALAAAAG